MSTTEQPTVFGAILIKGGRHDHKFGTSEYQECDSFEKFDVWRFTSDFNELMAAPDDKVIVAESADERLRELEEKYPPPAENLTYLVAFRGEVRTSIDTTRQWGNHYNEDFVEGARVLDFPMVTEQVSDEQLEHLCIEHRSVYAKRYDVDAYRLKQNGFCVYEGEHRWRITYNPRHHELKAWRVQRDAVQQLLEGVFPAADMDVIRQCLCPSNWPGKHKYGHMFRAWEDNSVSYIMRLLAVNKELFPTKRAWRKQQPYSGNNYVRFKEAVEHLLVYVWGVEEKARAAIKNPSLQGLLPEHQINLDFCTWLRAEAKAMKIKMPPKPVLPPKPLSAREIEKQAERKERARLRKRKQVTAKKAAAILLPAPPKPAASDYIVQRDANLTQPVAQAA